MGYLLTQIYLYMLVALLLGVALGWLIWGQLRSRLVEMRATHDAVLADNARLKNDVEAAVRDKEALERRWREAESALVTTGRVSRDKTIFEPIAIPAGQPAEPTAKRTTEALLLSEPRESVGMNFVPEPLHSAPPRKKASAVRKRDGRRPVQANDDLQRIYGIGPVNERLLHEQGVRTFNDVAAWTDGDVSRMEEALELEGNIQRERWVEQARLLSTGNEAEFAERFARGQTIG